jgi:hypothetical protein
MEIFNTLEDKPPRMLIYANNGLGKSSFAAAAPNPVIIQTEDGLENIDANAFPLCLNFEMMMSQLTEVHSEKHDYKTLVIDSLDWTEGLVFKDVCKKGRKSSISDFGYGVGFQTALEQFGRVIRALTAIRNDREMIIIITAHSHIKTYQKTLP